MAGKKDELYRLAAQGGGDELRSALRRHKVPSKDAHVDSVRKQPKYANPYHSYRSSPKDAPPNGLTLLHVACTYGNESSVKTLLELGASPSERTPEDSCYFDISGAAGGSAVLGKETCLHLAAASGSGAVVELLLSAGADINACSANGCTPLMTASTRHQTLTRTAGNAAEDSEGDGSNASRSPEAREVSAEAEGEAVKCGDDNGDEEEDFGKGESCRLATFQREESLAATALIVNGADMEAHCKIVLRSAYRGPGLHARQELPASVWMNKEWLYSRVAIGMTALHWAVGTGDYGIARSLVAAGADVNARTFLRDEPDEGASMYSDTHQTALHFAAELGDVEVVRLLLAGGADVNVKDEFLMTPLHQVFGVSEEEYLERNNWTLQSTHMAAVKRNRLAVTELLLLAGGDGDALALVAENYIERGRRLREGKPREYQSVSSLAQLNPNTGGPEVVEMLTSLTPQTRGLKSSCRLTIRQCLSRPILRHHSVDVLPLPPVLKDYVAMVTV